MNFEHSDDRRMMADTFQRFIAANSDPFRRAAAAKIAPGYDAQTLKRFADLGGIGALFPSALGGMGGNGFDIMVVFEEIGRGLFPEPTLSALMSGTALSRSVGHQETLDAIMAGRLVVAFAHQELEARFDPHFVATRALPSKSGWTLSGLKTVIRDAEESGALLVTARTGGEVADQGGISMFLVPTNTDRLVVRGYPCIDGGRAAEVSLDQVWVPETAVIGPIGSASTRVDDAICAGTLALCAEALGVMDVVRTATLDYLRTRVQFGEPIGRNQALQHRMASLLIEIEQARSAVINAAAVAPDASDSKALSLSAAKYTIGKTGTLVAEEAIQLHGGIGMTWELPMTHYAKRLLMIDHQLGDEDYHLTRYSTLARAA